VAVAADVAAADVTTHEVAATDVTWSGPSRNKPMGFMTVTI
jgi:hypothetical protein